jgi:hypothetical protein
VQHKYPEFDYLSDSRGKGMLTFKTKQQLKGDVVCRVQQGKISFKQALKILSIS